MQENLTKGWKLRTPMSVAGIISVITGLLAIYGVDRTQRLFQARIKIDILNIKVESGLPIADVEITNKSDLLLDTANIFVKVTKPNGTHSEGRLPAVDLAPNEEKEYSIRMDPFLPEKGAKVELCVEAVGPLPLTKAIWTREYQYTNFVPKAGGRPMCRYGAAELLKYKTLPPEAIAEQKAGCVMPEFANPQIDYIPIDFSLDEISRLQNWGVPGIIKGCSP
ncbi:hypothetical protein [Pleomorphomonas oryzae]|uniref:hypothetical protein n=1 Tax=Pleomorphomonas oryzae TaxID=261934 RepID=UPI0012EB4284|nr:hypothetical protein [Pleomorphomonas oryzae]